MKKIFLLLSVFTVAAIQSCNKQDSPGDNYDFTDSLPAYVTLSSTAAKTVKQGTSTTFTFQMRSAFQQVVTVTYDITGAVTLANQTVVIDRDKTSGIATVNIPGNVVVAPATANATLTLTKATTADGQSLTIGQRNTPATQKVSITITP